MVAILSCNEKRVQMKIFKVVKIVTIAAAASVYSLQSFAEQKILMIESTITGSQEQPRVISIVPWQGIEEPEYIGEDLQLDMVVDVFKPIERSAFNKEVGYIKATRRIK